MIGTWDLFIYSYSLNKNKISSLLYAMIVNTYFVSTVDVHWLELQ